jgi:regulator of protease activity HflC (stomatin/prohibitin superfamily)
VVAVALLLLAIYMKSFSIIVHEAEVIIIERLGRFHRLLPAGFHFLAPFVDQPRQFSWQRTEIGVDGKIHDRNISSTRIDLRESVFNFLRQEVFSKDTVRVSINTLMVYRISDAKKALYEVDDLQSALSNTAQTVLKDICGQISFTELLTSQEAVNDHLMREFSTLFRSWGLDCIRLEILELSPSDEIGNAMQQQMLAERDRRCRAIRAEGDRTAMQLRAEAEKQSKMTLAVANEEAMRKRSEGTSQARVDIASAEARALGLMSEAVRADGYSQTDYMLSQRYLDFVRAAGTGPESKSLILPFEVGPELSGVISDLPRIFGTAAPAGSMRIGEARRAARAARVAPHEELSPALPVAVTPAVADTFDDLS